MVRRRQAIVLSALVPLLGAAGCDALDVRSFSGTVIQLTLSNAPPTPAGQHLELWARDRFDDIVRIDPFFDQTNYKASYGLMIRQAISLDDPCLIDEHGNLITTAAAYPSSVTVAGVVQTPDEQAKQVVDRINQMAPPGRTPLMAVLPYDPTPPPAVPTTASAPERLTACRAYEAASEVTYVANPLQITAPAHGAVYGFTHFVTTAPPSNYDGFRLDTPVGLPDVQEIFFTVEQDAVDANRRGPLYLTSARTPGGQGVIHFDLIHADPAGTESGGATLYVDLDADPVQF